MAHENLMTTRCNKKCTLCGPDLNQNLPEADRIPACVLPAPRQPATWHFADPNSDVSKMTAARGGYDLMPEQDAKPINISAATAPQGGGTSPTETSQKLANASPEVGFRLGRPALSARLKPCIPPIP